MDSFRTHEWVIDIGGREVFRGQPAWFPGPPGRYEFRGLIAPADLAPGDSTVTLYHGKPAADPPSKVWTCPVTIKSSTTTTTTPTTTTTTPGKVALTDFSVACSPSALSATPGGSAPSTCTVKSTGGFNKAVTLACSGQPVGAACAFKPLTVTPPPNGSVNSALTVNVLGDAEPGDFSFQVVGTSGSTTRRAAMKLAITTEPVPPPPPNEPPTLPAPREEEIKLDRPSAEPGGELTVRGKGCDPNAPVEVFVDDEKAGSGEADSEGDFRVPIKLPEEAEVGRHEVAAECGPTLSTNVDVVIAVQSQAAAASVAPIATLAILIFFMLELRRLIRREGAVTPRR